MGRHKADEPGKYRHPELLSVQARTVEEVAAVLKRAIEAGLPGFAPGEPIGVRAAAEGLGSSRTTVAKALDELTRWGLLLEGDPASKMPQRIAGPMPPTGVLDSAAEALTEKPIKISDQSEDQSVILSPFRIRLSDAAPADPVREAHREQLARELAASNDHAVRGAMGIDACRERWDRDEVLVFQRVRHKGNQYQRLAWLLEITYLSVGADRLDRLEAHLERAAREAWPTMSLTTVLPTFVDGFRTGWTRLGVSAMLAPLRETFRTRLAYEPKLAPIPALEGEKVLTWRHGMFASVPLGLISYTFSYVDSDVMEWYAGTLHPGMPATEGA